MVTVEVDPQMFQLAGEELHRFDNVVMLQLDALKNKNRLNPAVLEAVRAQLAAAPGRRFKLVANLPYNIATPILGNLLAEDDPPQTMTATIQKELAERITARPGSKDYSALSIWVQSQCRVEILRILPPEAFWPRPKVSSAFIQITLDEALRRRIPDRKFFHEFLRAMFCHRRKFLRSELLTCGERPARQARGRCHPRPAGPLRLAPGRTTRRRHDAGPVRGRARRVIDGPTLAHYNNSVGCVLARLASN